MPGNARSLQITDAYRDRLNALADRLAALTLTAWQQITPENLDHAHDQWLTTTVAMLQAVQRAGVHVTAAYLASFISSELGRSTFELPHVDDDRYVGLADDGQPLTVPLSKTLIAIKTAIKDGDTPETALAQQATRAVRIASMATLAAPRAALAGQIATHPLLIGWQRVTHGGCGACLASASRGYDRHEPMHVHAHCHCTQEPVVKNVPDTAPRATGPEIFHRMTAEQQDKALGPQAAQLVRQGRVAWPDLIATSPMHIGPDWLTQAPIALAA